MTKKWRHVRKSAFLFSGWIGLLKIWFDRVKTMGTRGKINAIWWNIKINLQKSVGTAYVIWIVNKFAKFHAKRLSRSENIPKSWGGYFFWKILYVVYTCRKLFNFINAFACYKQKCKLAPFNMVHPVYKLVQEVVINTSIAHSKEHKCKKQPTTTVLLFVFL